MADMVILQLHGEALRAACSLSGKHHQGLQAAARTLSSAGLIGAKVKRGLLQLDIAAAWCRHATVQRSADFLAELAAGNKKEEKKGNTERQAEAKEGEEKPLAEQSGGDGEKAEATATMGAGVSSQTSAVEATKQVETTTSVQHNEVNGDSDEAKPTSDEELFTKEVVAVDKSLEKMAISVTKFVKEPPPEPAFYAKVAFRSAYLHKGERDVDKLVATAWEAMQSSLYITSEEQSKSWRQWCSVRVPSWFGEMRR